MRRLFPPLALAAAALLSPAAPAAQEPSPRDTIVIVARDAFAAPDTAALAPPDSVPARRAPRWAQPFSVQSSGRVAAHPPAGRVVWLSPDSVRARRRAAAGAGDDAPAVVAIDSLEAAADPARRAELDADAAAAEPEADSAPAPRRTPRETPPVARGRTHTVAAGETFFGIARRYGVTTAQLRAVNPDVDWERLEIGTVLALPARARIPAEPARRAEGSGERAAPATRQPQAAGRRTHTVAQGETLYGIARRYGVTVDALKAANGLEGDRVRVGQTLVIPRSQPR